MLDNVADCQAAYSDVAEIQQHLRMVVSNSFKHKHWAELSARPSSEQREECIPKMVPDC